MIGLVVLLLAVPVLGLSEVGFAGLTIKRSAEKAEAAAKQATEAAEEVSAAAASVASARAASTAAGNIVHFGGATNRFEALDSGVAFTFAAAGVVDFLRNLEAWPTPPSSRSTGRPGRCLVALEDPDASAAVLGATADAVRAAALHITAFTTAGSQIAAAPW